MLLSNKISQIKVSRSYQIRMTNETTKQRNSLLLEKFGEIVDLKASLWIGCQDLPDLIGQRLDVAPIDQADLHAAAVVLLHTQALVQLA